MASKQRQLEDKGYDPAALAITLGSEREVHKLQIYGATQECYIKWAVNRDVDPYTPNPTQLTNWLAFGVTTCNWKANTVNTYYKAIKQLYDDPSVFEKDMDSQAFLSVVKSNQVKELHELDVDLSPIQDFFLTQDIATLSMQELTAHTNPRLCLVATFTEYYSQIKDFPCSIPHPKACKEEYTPLIRSTKIGSLTSAVGKDTISCHAQSLNHLLPLPEGMTAPHGHTTGSSAAFQAGTPISDITAYANWSSSILFDKFYHLGSNTGTNFTTAILRAD
ncbi:hypothetical protein BGZ74_004056 [Mortierella antarctica]|nr:hypothetical protein BGZ74_004056 [Mortierella antarctica]